jgi:acetolactate synthase I/II/III large subunit
MMALAELETAVRLKLPMAILVYNDSAYGAEVHHFGPMGHAVDLTQFDDVDFAAIGRAVGAEGVTVRSVADLAPLEDWLARRAGGSVGPIVLDAKVTPTIVAEWLEDAFRAH